MSSDRSGKKVGARRLTMLYCGMSGCCREHIRVVLGFEGFGGYRGFEKRPNPKLLHSCLFWYPDLARGYLR